MFLAATSNLRVEQNLVHLGRFLHFSQKVIGVTLKEKNRTVLTHRNFILNKFVLFVLALDQTGNVFLYFDLYGHGKLDLKFVHGRAER